MKKVVVKLEIHDDKEKKKVMKAVSSLSGIETISIELKDRKLTVIGDVDPIAVVNKLKKLCHTELLTVGPAKEPEKKKDDKKEDGKKEDDKKDDEKKKEQQIQELVKAYQNYYPPYIMPQYVHHTADEHPSSCVIS